MHNYDSAFTIYSWEGRAPQFADTAGSFKSGGNVATHAAELFPCSRSAAHRPATMGSPSERNVVTCCAST